MTLVDWISIIGSGIFSVAILVWLVRDIKVFRAESRERKMRAWRRKHNKVLGPF